MFRVIFSPFQAPAPSNHQETASEQGIYILQYVSCIKERAWSISVKISWQSVQKSHQYDVAEIFHAFNIISPPCAKVLIQEKLKSILLQFYYSGKKCS